MIYHDITGFFMGCNINHLSNGGGSALPCASASTMASLMGILWDTMGSMGIQQDGIGVQILRQPWRIRAEGIEEKSVVAGEVNGDQGELLWKNMLRMG